MGPAIQTDAALPEKTGSYPGVSGLHKNDSFCFHGSTRRSVSTVQASRLLARANPTVPDSQGNTPLCLAAQAGNRVQAQRMIRKGADVHHINLDGDNVLTLAAAGGHLKFIKWFNGHYPQPVDHENYYAETALTLAARHGHQPLVQWLVSRDASAVHLNDQLRDALAEAVANGHLALAIWLASQDTDLRRVYPDGNNLFLHAVHAGHQHLAQWLEASGVDSQQTNESGDNALTLAVRQGHHQLLAWLLEKHTAGIDQISRNGDSLLLTAARQGHGETVKLLVQHGADIRQVNYAGSSVLTLAAASNESLALWLCDSDTDIHHIDCSGNNAFTLAAQSGFFQLMQTLERLSINIHQVNHNNDNAFTLVAGQGSLPWCQWLAGKGVNIHQVNCQHHNAVTLAALAGSLPLLQWLGSEDVDCQQIPKAPAYDSECSGGIPVSYSFNAAILAASAGHFTEAQWLMGRGLSIHQRDYLGRNAVIQAVRLGQLDAVQWFTARGIMPDGFPDKFLDYCKISGYNAMSLAAHLGHRHIIQWLYQNGGSLDAQNDQRVLLIMAARRGDLAMTQWLCRQGADLGCLDNRKASALSVAVSCGHLRLSQWLVGQGAKDTPDIDGNDALMLAVRGGHNAICRWLIRSRHLDGQQANNLLLCALRSGHRSLAVWLCLKVCQRFGDADNRNCNALMLAAKHGFLWLAQWLSEHTPGINQANDKGSALMLAAENGHLPVVQWLYQENNALPYRKNWLGAYALQMAVAHGHIETAKWLGGRGMVEDCSHTINLWHNESFTGKCNKVELLQYMLRQQEPPEHYLHRAMLDAAGDGDVPALACCLSAGISLRPNGIYRNSCFDKAAAAGSLAALKYLCDWRGCDVDSEKKFFLSAAASSGNLHIIQWFSARSTLSQDEKNECLLFAASRDQFHVVKWLCSQGAGFGEKNDWGNCALFYVMNTGNVAMLEWFCQRGGDIAQIDVNGQSVLSLAIDASQPQVALWLLGRGCGLTKRDIAYTFHRRRLSPPKRVRNSRELLLGMIFAMTSKIHRASLFHACSLQQKFWLLYCLGLYGVNEKPSEEEVDACFARFNQYNYKTLEHKCLLAVSRVIKQRSGTLKACLDAIDSLPVSCDCKGSLRELAGINLA